MSLFSLIIVGLVKSPNQPALELQELSSGDERECPFCAEPNRHEAVICRYCGRSLSVAVPSPRRGPSLETKYKVVRHTLFWAIVVLVAWLVSGGWLER